MNYFFLLLPLVLLFVVIFFIKNAAKGPVRTIGQLQRPLEDLLQRGFDGGVLFIDHIGSPKFLQYSKYIHRKGEYGIELGFPDAEWSKEFYPEVKKICELKGFEYRQEGSNQHNELVFLNVDCGMNTKMAYQLARDILTEIFGCSDDDRYHVRLLNASNDDQIIDSKDKNGGS